MTDHEIDIQRLQEALEARPKEHPDRATLLSSLGHAYANRYEQTGTMTDLDVSLQRFQEALDATLPEDHLNLARRIGGIALVYSHRYDRLGAMEDLEMYIQRSRDALEMTPKGHFDTGKRLQTLGKAYGKRYRKSGAMEDLETAIMRLQEALDATPEDHPDFSDRLIILGVGYQDRYRRTGAIKDLNMAVELMQRSVHATPENHSDLAFRLHNLSGIIGDRYYSTGAIADIEASLEWSQKAVDATPKDHIQRARRLHNLGAAYQDRFERTGAIADLDIAIALYQEVVDSTPADHPDLGRRLYNLSLGYSDRYQRSGWFTHLEIAIERSREALDATPVDHPDRHRRLANLGNRYHDRFQQTGAISDLDKTLQHYQEALDVIPDDHHARADRLASLGHGYQDRYEATKMIVDLDTAILRYQKSIEITPDDNPDLADRLDSLGAAYNTRYERTGAASDHDLAIRQYQKAVEHISAPARDRLGPCMNLLKLHARAENWSLAYLAASAGVSLIPSLTLRSLETADKQHLLIQIAGLASDAAAVALMVGGPSYEVIQLLEFGRGIILGSLNEMRLDSTELEEKYPEKAKEYLQLRHQLVTSIAPTSQDAPLPPLALSQQRSDERYNLGKRMEEIIRTIRELPEFDQFLLGPSELEVRAAAALGPIIVINVSEYRCDALIIEACGISVLNLPLLRVKDVRNRLMDLRTGLIDSQTLKWLWETSAKSILDKLMFFKVPHTAWPRVRWVPTGSLASFPLHAAGDYEAHGSDSVMDRVVSSYGSTIRLLLQSRQNSVIPSAKRTVQAVTLLGMPELPFALREIDKLKDICRSMNLKVNEPPATQKEVLSALNNCDIFHFAGHGRSNPSDPSTSALVLSDKELTVSDLFEANLLSYNPFLAYLSACGTGQVKHDTLMDEGLHLIAACQLAGFRHVIGTLWEVNDSSCVDIALETYMWMQKCDVSDQSVSEGLHHACRKLREQWILDNDIQVRMTHRIDSTQESEMTRDQMSSGQDEATRDLRDVVLYHDTPLHWVPYVHFGL